MPLYCLPAVALLPAAVLVFYSLSVSSLCGPGVSSKTNARVIGFRKEEG